MSEQTRFAAIFYLGVPLVVGLLLGTNQTGVGSAMPWFASVIFWVTCTLGAWAVFHVGTLIGTYLLRPWEPNLILKLTIGLLIASLPARWFINQYVRAYEPFMLEGRETHAIPAPDLSVEFIIGYTQTWLGIYVLWISTNIFFDKVVGFSRYRSRPTIQPDDVSSTGHWAFKAAVDRERDEPVSVADQTEERSPTAVPDGPNIEDRSVSVLLSKLPRSLGLKIRALKSEDHYLRVYTDRGNTLILYRLSTAIEELETLGYSGFQTHRSYWVRRKAIKSIEKDGRKWHALLDIDLQVPISQTYRERLRSEGFVE